MGQHSTRSAALRVLRTLRQAGFQALFAGGCVRDMLLGARSSDYDVATDASPEQVRRLFPRVLLVGAQFGVAMVMVGPVKVEVATFRSDLAYVDGRRPEGVVFSTPREDALRRDFTINGMFYDPAGREVIDYVGGQEDLRRGVIRTIGCPRQRFGEDYLRMLRAVRFAVRLGFAIEPETAAAIRELAGRIRQISGERVLDELSKMLQRGDAADALARLHELGLAAQVLGELFAGGAEAWQAGLARVRAVAGRRDLTLTLSALLASLDERAIVDITRRWGASNELREAACWLAGRLGEWTDLDRMELRQLKRRMASPQFDRLRRLWRVEEARLTGRQTQSRRLAGRLRRIDPAQVAPAPLVTGEDLKTLGLREGPRLGTILRRLYDLQLDECLTSRPAALQAAREILAEPG